MSNLNAFLLTDLPLSTTVDAGINQLLLYAEQQEVGTTQNIKQLEEQGTRDDSKDG